MSDRSFGVVSRGVEAGRQTKAATKSLTSAFLRLLEETRHVHPRLRGHGYALAAGPRVTTARSASFDNVAGDRWLAVGDAALALDPLSSQGILTAMYSGMLAGRALDAHLSGNPKRLASYPSRLAAIGTAYQRNRQAFYAMEWRWPDRVFWRRRTGSSSRAIP